jgi:hypothetical protein
VHLEPGVDGMSCRMVVAVGQVLGLFCNVLEKATHEYFFNSLCKSLFISKYTYIFFSKTSLQQPLQVHLQNPKLSIPELLAIALTVAHTQSPHLL